MTTLLTGVFGNSSGFFSTSNEPSGNDDSQSSFETTEKKGNGVMSMLLTNVEYVTEREQTT